MTVTNPKSPEIIVLDQEESSNNSSNSRNNPSSSSGVSRVVNNSNIVNNTINDVRTLSVQQLNNFVRNLGVGEFDGNSECGIRTENVDSSSSEVYADYSGAESYYSTSGYLCRRGEAMQSLDFNVRKILVDYDPESTNESLDEIRSSGCMSAPVRKNVTYAISEFLMVVYGENPPRFAKEYMAISLHNFFPFVSKETWWCKVPLKNPSGSLEHKINNRRRQLQDERKKQAIQDEGNVHSILGLT